MAIQVLEILAPIPVLDATGAAIEARSESPLLKVVGRIFQMVPVTTYLCLFTRPTITLVQASAVLCIPLLVHVAKDIMEISGLPGAKAALDGMEKVLMTAIKILNLVLNIFLLYGALYESSFLIAGILLTALAVNLAHAFSNKAELKTTRECT